MIHIKQQQYLNLVSKSTKNGKIYLIQLWDLVQDNARLTKIFARGSHDCVILSNGIDIKKREE